MLFRDVAAPGARKARFCLRRRPASALVPGVRGRRRRGSQSRNWTGRGSHRFPQFLPDRAATFIFYAEGTPDKSDEPSRVRFTAGSLDSHRRQSDWSPAAESAGLYMPSGWLLWVRTGTLVAGRLDLAGNELSGNPVTVADSVFFDTSHARLFSVSATGLIAYRRGTPNLQLTWFDRSGKAVGALAAPADNDGYAPSNPRISPDGRSVVVHRRMHDQTDLWLLNGTTANRLTFLGAVGGIWSPDGRQIAFQEGARSRSFETLLFEIVRWHANPGSDLGVAGCRHGLRLEHSWCYCSGLVSGRSFSLV